MNLPGKEDAWDNLIRVKDAKAASELLALEHVWLLFFSSESFAPGIRTEAFWKFQIYL